MFIFLILGCASVPRDEAETYEHALAVYRSGDYEQAIPLLKHELDKDSDYANLYEVLAHSFYMTGHPDSTMKYLKKGESFWKKNIENALLSVKTQITTKESQKDFLSYVNSVARKFDMDPGLLLAFMHQESAFKVDAISSAGAVGLVQLMPATAKALGLKVPPENYVKEPEIKDHKQDERFHPGKNIYASARHISFLLQHYKKGKKKRTDLQKAIAAYLSGTGNVKDSIPNYAKHYVNKVSGYYKDYRYNDKTKAKAADLYNKRNKGKQFFSSYSTGKISKGLNSVSKYIKKMNNLGIDIQRSAFYNNLALASNALGENQKADSLFNIAVSLDPKNVTTYTNYAVFLYNTDQMDKCLNLLLHPPTNDLELILVLKSGIYLAKKQYNKAVGTAENGIRMYPDNLLLSNNLALGYFFTRERDKALSILSSLTSEADNQVIINNYLCVLYDYYYAEQSRITYTLFTRLNDEAQSEYIWPTDRINISSYYGWRPNPVLRNWDDRLEDLDFHYGIDIPGAEGDPIYAVKSGIVTTSTFNDVSGNVVVLQHDDGGYSVYYHMSKRVSAKGDRVKQGDIIGEIGTTGRSTGNHLHYGLYDKNWKPLNPILFYPFF